MVTPIVLAGWLVCLLLSAAETQDSVIFKKVGDEVVLRPSSKPDVIKTILWRDGPNIAMEWDGENIESYRHFKVRGSLDNSSGALTIKSLIQEDSGFYTPHINNNAGKPIYLKIISPVLKPHISVSCDEGKKNCTLSCDGDTTGAEPVNYTWKFDSKQKGSSKELHLTQENSENIQELICELKNPVSQESSGPVSNPFTGKPESNLKISSGLTVFICLLAVVFLVVIVHKVKSGKWFFQKESMPWEADFWRKTEGQQPGANDSNGTTYEEKGAADEGMPMKA
ncbi:T-lymphocyte surface antigen Ly-9-like isoform X2 [Sphaeramia orbicularis]|uniref:T-lymphocyte surface antigen Ly-9-like isoform X2 n=1 Tax=Sphaeramia orbicularis TaxID=375764 RepID=UPI00117DA6D0|nr:T-lymphocyte surface antigen Ly-9-like isoform X2 [Sphaeramia orbicularis]